MLIFQQEFAPSNGAADVDLEIDLNQRMHPTIDNHIYMGYH
jgi:hypothetical protein